MARTDTLGNFLTDIAASIKSKKEYSSETKISASNFDTEIEEIQVGVDTSDATAVASNIASGATAYVKGEKLTGDLTVYDKDHPYMHGIHNVADTYNTWYGDSEVISYMDDTYIYALKSTYSKANGLNQMLKIPREYIEQITDGKPFSLRIYDEVSSYSNYRVNLLIAPDTATRFILEGHDGTYDLWASNSENLNMLASTFKVCFIKTMEDLKTASWSTGSNSYDSGYSNKDNGYFYCSLPPYYSQYKQLVDLTVGIDPKKYKYLTKITGGTYDDAAKDRILAGDAEVYTPINIDAIAEKEGIVAENIKKGVTMMNITGTLDGGIDTSDATAASSDIASGQTAYVNGEKVTGNIRTVSSGSSMSYLGTLWDYKASPQLKAQVNMPSDILLRKDAELGISLQKSDIATAENLTADMLLSGNTVLGIEGTAEAGGSSSFIENSFTSTSNGAIELITSVPTLNTSTTTSMYNMFRYGKNITTIANMNTMLVRNTGWMCEWCSNLTTFPNWNTYNVTNMVHMFSNCSNLLYVPDLDTTACRNMGYMFEGCVNLQTAPNLITNNVTFMTGMFNNCRLITETPDYNSSSVNGGTSKMFANCISLTKMPNLELGKVVSADSMFYNCQALTGVVPDYNLMNVQYASNMFYLCTNITAAGSYNSINAYYSNNMFYGCKNLQTVEMINFPNTAVAEYMFSGCENLKSINIVNIQNCWQGANYMFRYCYNLTGINTFISENCVSVRGMFYCCYNLDSVPYFNTAKCTSFYQTFENCYALVNVPQYNTAKFTNLSGVFIGCNNLSDASIQNIVNMCLNSNITSSSYKTLLTNQGASPFYQTNISNDRYTNRWDELTAAGWVY